MTKWREALPPKDYAGIVKLVTLQYARLSPGCQVTAQCFTQNPNVVALKSINAPQPQW